MKWFPFQGIMLHATDNIECPSEHLKVLLKLFSIFKIKILYDETIDNEDVPEAVRIMYINCRRIIGCLLDNKTIKTFVTPFFITMVFQNVFYYGSSNRTKNSVFISNSTVLIG